MVTKPSINKVNRGETEISKEESKTRAVVQVDTYRGKLF